MTSHYDDGHSVLRNPHIRSLESIPHFFTDSRAFSERPEFAMYRPLVLVAHSLNFAWSEYNPTGYVMFNLVCHSMATIAVYYLLCALGFTPITSLTESLVFGLHPGQTEAVNYISSRSELLMALFYLIALGVYVRIRTGPGRSGLMYGLSLAAYLASMLSKSVALTLPFTLLALEWIQPGSALTPHRQKLSQIVARFHWPYWFLSILYIVWYWTRVPGGLDRSSQLRSMGSQMATQAKALVHYIKAVFQPALLNVHQQFFESPGLLEPAALLAFAVTGSLVFLAIRRRRRAAEMAFALIWLPVVLLPTIVIPLHILVNDHRLYLPLFGLALAVSWICSMKKSESDRVIQRWMMPGLILLSAVTTWQRTPAWSSEVALWRDAARKAPLMPEAQYNLAHAYHDQGELQKARTYYEKAVELSPAYAKAQSRIGVQESGK